MGFEHRTVQRRRSTRQHKAQRFSVREPLAIPCSALSRSMESEQEQLQLQNATLTRTSSHHVRTIRQMADVATLMEMSKGDEPEGRCVQLICAPFTEWDSAEGTPRKEKEGARNPEEGKEHVVGRAYTPHCTPSESKTTWSSSPGCSAQSQISSLTAMLTRIIMQSCSSRRSSWRPAIFSWRRRLSKQRCLPFMRKPNAVRRGVEGGRIRGGGQHRSGLFRWEVPVLKMGVAFSPNAFSGADADLGRRDIAVRVVPQFSACFQHRFA